MNKIGLASVAAVVLSGSALAGNTDREALLSNVIDGGEARMLGTFSRASLDAMRGVAAKASPFYSTNWTSDSNGASYTVGNISSSVAGAQGQGGWYTFSTGTTGNNTALSNYKISAGRPAGHPGGATGQGLQITGSSTNSGSRFMYTDLSAQWAARNAGDDIFWAEYTQFCSSASSTSANRAGSLVFDTSGTKFITGMAVDMGTVGTSTSQRSIYGYANYQPTGGALGNYRFKLSDATLTSGGTSPRAVSGGWTVFMTSYNKTTGEVNFFYSVDSGTTFLGFFVPGAHAGSDVLDFNYYTTNGGTTNTSGVTVNYGNLAVYATPAPGAAALVGLAGLLARRRRA